ncbi:MAG: histidinol dehydrogenase [Bacillota bacterium]
MIILKDARKEAEKNGRIAETVAGILEAVRRNGDRALVELTRRYDGVELKTIKVPKGEIEKAYAQTAGETVAGIRFAAERIRDFAARQLACLQPLEYASIPGVTLGHRLIPVSSCGVYVPGGRYPLPSSALMAIIPARVAGVKRVAACSPPAGALGGIHPVVLVAMDIAGADEIYCMGGAQAVAAYAFGTESVPPVDLIVGPGNKFVTEAKRQLSGLVGIDLLAGPSEVLIIADESASPRLVAVELLAQCEHDPASAAVLVTTSRELAEQVLQTMEEELPTLETARLASRAWAENGKIILVSDLEEAVDVADRFAPEHLQLQTRRNEELAARVRNYGSLFIGDCATVAFGDYVSGPNHILPTMGSARFASGVWAGTFIKVAPFQKVTPAGAAALAGSCAHLAGVEGLAAHRRAAELRKG